MLEPDDITLLRQYTDNGSESAFAALVERHLNLVYSFALRRVGNPLAAEEIVQAVFIILARKAKSLGARTVLTGWLYQTTRLTTANFLRGEIRRHRREQEAFMQSALNESEAATWSQIAPILDDAIARLGARDREAILLRFFENKDLRAVGAALGASEAAAKMRVNRAVEKLRNFFLKRGITLSAAVIAGAVSANSVHAAPAGLAQSVATVAAAKGAGVGGSTLTLVKGALKLMAWTKAKTAGAIGLVAILATTSTIIIGTRLIRAHHAIAEPTTGLIALGQELTANIQADGTIRFRATMEVTNNTAQVINIDTINDVDAISRITDESGRPMQFTKRPGGGVYVMLNPAVPPGGKASYTIDGTLTGMIKRNGAGEYEIGLEQKLSDNPIANTHYVEVWRLPAGATLLKQGPGMQATTNSGQIELQVDRLIPPNGVLAVGFRYRLADAAR
jgi:RNA polymerase sigma factor (sigma-70 family)